MISSAVARRAADIILRGFEEFHGAFRTITRRSVERFERRDWDGVRRDTVRRMGLHSRALEDTLVTLRDDCGVTVETKQFWTSVKEAYTLAILGSNDFELAQTFFNSLTRRVFSHVGVDPDIDYLSRDFPLPFNGWEMASARMYAVRRIEPVVMRKILEDAGFRVPFADLDASAKLAAHTARETLRMGDRSQDLDALDFLRPVLIRNKAAYLIGRARRRGRVLPLVIPILNRDDGLVVDGVLHDENEVSKVFSFARWYFHADLESPREAIGFLHSLLPRKRISELYISLGYNKHGKTEFYSDLTNYIKHTQEHFIIAPGVPGLVMSVFTLPSYEFVFKVIRDHFPASKTTTRRKIRDRYRQVLMHDRVGRLVDFQEFEHLEFPRRRFARATLTDLLETAATNVTTEGDKVIIHHLYVGRRVLPLDLFLASDAPEEEKHRVVIDWGNALKELAAANIFAGDMLLKNFGVTRHGRVVFYDYDEICPLTACRFRNFPRVRTEEDEMAAEPQFHVRDGDIFPRELRTFLSLQGSLNDTFEEHHGDLFERDFWVAMQEHNRQGQLVDFYPYSDADADPRRSSTVEI